VRAFSRRNKGAPPAYGRVTPRGAIADAFAPNDLWAADLLTIGNHIVLVIVDYFSRFAILRRVRDKAVVTVASELAKVANVLGWPVALLTDQGGEFMNKVLEKLLESHHCQRRETTAFHPQCNGVTERLNRTVLAILRTVVGDVHNVDAFERALMVCAEIYNNTKHTTTNSIPYQLYFRREPPPLSLVDDATGSRILKAKATAEKKESENAKENGNGTLLHGIEAGCRVLIYDNIGMASAERKLLLNRWRGPFEVIAVDESKIKMGERGAL
jgi:transposase InsO family protein